MISFALITEGITDQAVLENLLTGFYEDEEVEVNPLQPLRDTTDESRMKQASFGSWEKVFEYCQHENFNDIFMFNDYVIIQIDTDVGEHPNFGVSLTYNGIDRPVAELVSEVRNLLMSKIGLSVCKQYENRFTFAIAVHSLECWLLPLHATGNSRVSKTKNCLKHLEREAQRLNLNCRKDYRCYYELSKKYSNRREIEKAKLHQESFELFLDSLPPP